MPSYRVPNYFQAQTPIGEGIQSLAGALFSGPGPLEMEQDRLKNAYMTAQTEHAQTQNKLGQAKLGAGGKISDFIKAGQAPLLEGQNRADVIRSGMANLASGLSDGGDIGQLGNLMMAAMANSGASDNDVIRSQAGTGRTIGVNDAVSLGGQQAVASRNQHDLMDKTRFQEGQQTARNSADISAANARNSANIGAAMSRLQWETQNKPLEVSAGATMYTAPGDVRGKGGPIMGRDTESTVKAAAFKALTPDQQRMAASGGEAFKQEDKLRADYEGQIKGFDEVQRNVGTMESLAKDKTGASDVALVFSFFKTIDPTSTVREGEFATAAKASGMPDQIVSYFQKLDNGQFLPENLRQQLVHVGRQHFDQRKQDIGRTQAQFTDMSNRYGLDSRNVVRDPMRPEAAPTPPPAQAAPPVQQAAKPRRTATNPATGQKLVYDETTRQWMPQ